MAKHECKYYLRDANGGLVCSVCGKPAPEKHEVRERELYISDKDKAEAEAKAKAEAKTSGEVPGGQ